MSRQTMQAPVNGLTMAGYLLRQWRNQHEPKLSGEEAAAELGLSTVTLYRIEAEGHVPGHRTAHRLVQRGIFKHEDFYRGPPTEDDSVAVCERCGERPEGPVARSCTHSDCPRRVVA